MIDREELIDLLNRTIEESQAAQDGNLDTMRSVDWHRGCEVTAKAILDFIGPRQNIVWDIEGCIKPERKVAS